MTQRKLAERLFKAIQKTGYCAQCICTQPCGEQKNGTTFMVEEATCIEGVRQWLMAQNKSKEVEE